MLLLFKAAPAGVAAATLGIGFGLSGIAGTQATVGIVLGCTPPESVELNVFVTPDIRFGVTAIPLGFLTRAATITTLIDLPTTGGYTASPSISLSMGLSGTVGSFLQGIATPDITHGLTASLALSSAASLATQLNLSGAPTISGGTLTPNATLTHLLNLSGSAVLTTLGTPDLKLDMTVGLFTLYAGFLGTVEMIRFEHQSRSIRFTHQ